jgi:hypothetical protein
MHAPDAGTSASASTRSPVADGPRPYPPSWLDRLLDWLDALPGPRILAYGALAVFNVALTNAALWTSGLLPVGALDPAQTFWGLYVPLLLVTVRYLDTVASESFSAFLPALGEAEDTRQLYELTVIPRGPAALILVLVIPGTLAYYLADPVGSQVVGYSALGIVLRGVGEIVAGAVILVLVYRTLRQLRVVAHLHRVARRVDIFEPRPLYAFSRLTSQTAIALGVFIGAPVFVVQPAFSSPNFWLLWGPWLVGIPAVAVAVFVIPMIGLHRRLEVEKAHLLAAADDRLRRLLPELDAMVDAREIDRADGMGKLLAAQQSQRDLLARLPTWPWSPGTLRGFLSALLLPVALFLIQRYLAALLPG